MDLAGLQGDRESVEIEAPEVMESAEKLGVLTDNEGSDIFFSSPGEVAEWLNAPVSKTPDEDAQPPAKSITYNPTSKSLPSGLPWDLEEVIRVWPSLPKPIRNAVIGVIRSFRWEVRR
jgi:hypothetical protein